MGWRELPNHTISQRESRVCVGTLQGIQGGGEGCRVHTFEYSRSGRVWVDEEENRAFGLLRPIKNHKQF